MLDALLFVDDDADLREAMCEVIGSLGIHQIVTAGSLKDVQAQRHDVLSCELALLDLNLGSNEPSGLSVFEWLEREGFAGRVVFLTGHGSRDPRVQEAANLSGVSVASKPLSLKDLRALIGVTKAAS